MRVAVVKSAAFTLIETLAAVALLGLIGSVAVVGLAGVGERARTSGVVAMLRDLDQRSRELAASEGPVALTIDSEARRFSVMRSRPVKQTLAERWLPAAVEVTVQDQGGRDVDVIRFDRLGRCDDYAVRIRAGERSFTLAISGLTGWMEEVP